MRSLPSICGIATALIALSATAPSAVAQENTATLTCQDVGWDSGPPEPLGDRKGHGITVGQYSCRVDSGPMSGGVSTGTIIWEWDGTNAVELSESGVIRKPGSTLVYRGTEGKLALLSNLCYRTVHYLRGTIGFMQRCLRASRDASRSRSPAR